MDLICTGIPWQCAEVVFNWSSLYSLLIQPYHVLDTRSIGCWKLSIDQSHPTKLNPTKAWYPFWETLTWLWSLERSFKRSRSNHWFRMTSSHQRCRLHWSDIIPFSRQCPQHPKKRPKGVGDGTKIPITQYGHCLVLSIDQTIECDGQMSDGPCCWRMMVVPPQYITRVAHRREGVKVIKNVVNLHSRHAILSIMQHCGKLSQIT